MIIEYINSLRVRGASYSVLNTCKSMLSQTLMFFGVDFSKFSLLSRMMTGCYNLNPPKVRYRFTWDVSLMLRFLSTLYPLEDLSLKLLTFKLISLMALTTAARAQTLSALNIKFLSRSADNKTVVFHIQDLLKTSRPGKSLPNLEIKHYVKPELCVVRTLWRYIKETHKVRKSPYLFISYVNFEKVTTASLARWLKTVLKLSGIDNSIFKARSYRGASTSAALAAGCSMKDILSTANWSSANTFHKYYHKNVVCDKDFASSVLNKD